MSVLVMMLLQGFITAIILLVLSSASKLIRAFRFARAWQSYLTERSKEVSEYSQQVNNNNDKVH